MKPLIKSSLLHSLATAILVGMPIFQAQAAPGTLPTSPLYLSTIVEPNVFLTMDDSRSMVFTTMISSDPGELTGITLFATDENIPAIFGALRVFLNPAVYLNNVVPPISVAPEAWVLKNHQANTLYYNPGITYQPWPGTDASGNALFREYDPTTELVPMFPNSATPYKFDLLATHAFLETPGHEVYLPTYYEWIDSNGDGVIDAATDAYTEVIIKSTDTAAIQNFANWFVYYRDRESSMKAAVGKIINNTDSNRMGLSRFNAGHQIDAATMSNADNKLALLNHFYDTPFVTDTLAIGLTPARTALEKVGKMFGGSLNGVPSPILAEADGGTCQQNFNIMMTDGYWNGPEPNDWGTKKPSDSLNTDGDSASTVSIFDGNAAQSNDGGNYADSYASTLADVAMHFYETDLDSNLLDEVPSRAGVDEATHQHLVNYTLSYGLKGTLNPLTQNPTDAGFTWPEPVSGTVTAIDDLWHAAYNSRGEYLSIGGSWGELNNALHESFTNVSERTGTASAVAVNSAKLSTESVVYLAQFNTNRWQGNLYAFPIIDSNTGELALEPKWDAGSELTKRSFTDNPRTIISYDKSLTSARKGVPFQWANLSTDMKNDLRTNPLAGTDSDTIASARLDYIRGDGTNESSGYLFRKRLSGLGDLVNSGPVFVGPPNLAWKDKTPFPTGTEAYSEFKKLHENRSPIVYVGANDGMLHAFDDTNGKEVLGYIPGEVYSQSVHEGLHYLSDPNYIHKYYVDLSPTISDAYISTGSSTEWHTVLIGGLRGGGRGIFALDVTNPGSFSEANAADISLWEFTSDDDADLGYTYSRPIIGLSNAGTWVAIFGNGYNSTGTGEASLFIVDIAKGTDGSWVAGDYIKITTGTGTAGDQNGLSPPALADTDGNGTIDRAYAGDLRGNMWVFDLSSTNSGNWSIAYKSGSTPVPLFTTPTNQQITAKPVLATHPTVPNSGSPTNAPNIMVYFGTGQYLVSGDKITTDVQSFYGVWDMGVSSMTQSNLVQQEFDTTYPDVRVLTRYPVDYSLNEGWFFNLTDVGERSVTSPIARADTVFFNTFVPKEDACSEGGYGYRFAVDMATGGSPLVPTIDSNNDGVIDDADYVSNGSGVIAAVRQDGFLPEPVFIEDLAFTGDQATKIKALSTSPTGRFSWQELLF